MKSDKRNPWHPAGAKGFQNNKTYSNAPSNTPKPDAGLVYPQRDDDEMFGGVARLYNPPPTLGVIFKVKADIARRGRSMPEVVFIAPDHHPEILIDLVRKVRALADELANLGSFVVCDRTGDSYIIAGVNEE